MMNHWSGNSKKRQSHKVVRLFEDVKPHKRKLFDFTSSQNLCLIAAIHILAGP